MLQLKEKAGVSVSGMLLSESMHACVMGEAIGHCVIVAVRIKCRGIRE